MVVTVELLVEEENKLTVPPTQISLTEAEAVTKVGDGFTTTLLVVALNEHPFKVAVKVYTPAAPLVMDDIMGF